MTNADLVSRVVRLRSEAEAQRARYEEAVAAYREAVAEAKAEMGATVLADELGVTRARIYQLLGE